MEKFSPQLLSNRASLRAEVGLDSGSRYWFTRSWVMVLVVFCCFFVLYTQNNDFAFYSHADAPGKVQQILKDTRNFHHPLLLLNSTATAIQFFGIEPTQQNIVEVGRTLSAVFAALTAAVFALLACEYYGRWAGLFAGFLIGTHNMLFHYAHYMKEDPSLLLGIALVFLTLAWFDRQPSWRHAAWLGLACAIAVSGKYIGVLMLLVALPVVIFKSSAKSGDGRVARVSAFLFAFLVVVTAINFRVIMEFDVFLAGFDREVDFVLRGHEGIGASIPHGHYFEMAGERKIFTPYYTVFLLAHLVFMVSRWRWGTISQWLILIFPLVFIGILSFSSKTSERYFAPVVVLGSYLAAIGLFELVYLLRRIKWLAPVSHRAWLLAVVSIAAVGMQLHYMLPIYQDFGRDSRQEMIAWITGNVPEDSLLILGKGVRLPHPKSKKGLAEKVIPQELLETIYVSDYQSVEGLRAEGIDYVILSKSESRPFLKSSYRPSANRKDDFGARRAFYQDLLKKQTIVWQSVRGKTVLNPEVRVIQLSGTAQQSQ